MLPSHLLGAKGEPVEARAEEGYYCHVEHAIDDREASVPSGFPFRLPQRRVRPHGAEEALGHNPRLTCCVLGSHEDGVGT